MSPLLLKPLATLLPPSAFYADHLTLSGRRLVARLGVGLSSVVIFSVSLGLLLGNNWGDALVGALFGFSVSSIVWAVTSYNRERVDTLQEIYRTAELDLLHYRLNQAAPSLGIPVLDLNSQIEVVLAARRERLAHFAGLDEFREETSPEGHDFWTSEGAGIF